MPKLHLFAISSHLCARVRMSPTLHTRARARTHTNGPSATQITQASSARRLEIASLFQVIKRVQVNYEILHPSATSYHPPRFPISVLKNASGRSNVLKTHWARRTQFFAPPNSTVPDMTYMHPYMHTYISHICIHTYLYICMSHAWKCTYEPFLFGLFGSFQQC